VSGACDGVEPEPFARDPALDDVQLASSATTSDSHENGENCMACHSVASNSAETAGPGLFSVGGSLWSGSPDALEPLAGATIELRTEPFGAGEVIASIPSDALGNAYTTQEIDFFGAPVFPHVVHPNGNAISMPFPTESGACNMCHHPGGIELIP
jgi:hypothetical protein